VIDLTERQVHWRLASFRTLVTAMIGVVAATAFLVAPSAAFGSQSNIGSLALRAPCCAGAALQGSRASIQSPTSWTVPNGNHAIMRAEAEGAGDAIIQIAYQVTNNIVIDNNPDCTSPSLAYFGETWNINTSVRCYFLGSTSAGTTHKYSVMKQDNTSTWQMFLDGVAPGGRIITISFPNTNAAAVAAGGEIVFCDTCSSAFTSWFGRYGQSGLTPWQRYNTTQGWSTIQSWTNTINGGGWSFSTGSFPTVWTVSH
jgi:hypothetical protein